MKEEESKDLSNFKSRDLISYLDTLGKINEVKTGTICSSFRKKDSNKLIYVIADSKGARKMIPSCRVLKRLVKSKRRTLNFKT